MQHRPAGPLDCCGWNLPHLLSRRRREQGSLGQADAELQEGILVRCRFPLGRDVKFHRPGELTSPRTDAAASPRAATATVM